MTTSTKYQTKSSFFGGVSLDQPHICRIKNTVIGSLLTDLTDGVELEVAVSKYEAKVSAGSFKRTTALVTPSMIKKAQAKVKELGLESALERRYATLNDITVNNTIYADRSIDHLNSSPFDELIKESKPRKVNKKNAVEISMDEFISDVVPHSSKIEALVSNTHMNNFVSLISPVDGSAKNMLKWDNNFTWSYQGEFTESIKSRVKKAGGNVDGVLRTSLSWFNSDDLDIHCVQNTGAKISYKNKTCAKTSGRLDVDMNAGSNTNNIDPVENITWSKEVEGRKTIVVHNYTKRSSSNVGFEVEIEYKGEILTFSYDKAMTFGERVTVAELEFKKGVMTCVSKIPSTKVSKDIWGISTENFHDVSVICKSPNHWNDNKTGNRHTMFMLKGCINPEESRGIYTEFLDDRLHEHRKVFEMLGAKMRVPKSNEQLSGLGFSSTLSNTLVCRVTKENKERLYKINIT